MNETKKPIIGGILTIISGLLGLLGIASYSIGFGDPGSGIGKGDMPPFIPSIIFGMSIPAIVIALLALVGGILALQRKRWRGLLLVQLQLHYLLFFYGVEQ